MMIDKSLAVFPLKRSENCWADIPISPSNPFPFCVQVPIEELSSFESYFDVLKEGSHLSTQELCWSTYNSDFIKITYLCTKSPNLNIIA